MLVIVKMIIKMEGSQNYCVQNCTRIPATYLRDVPTELPFTQYTTVVATEKEEETRKISVKVTTEHTTIKTKLTIAFAYRSGVN